MVSVLLSCQKIEEVVTNSVDSAKQKAQEKANQMVKETVTEKLGKLANAQNVEFDSIFPHQQSLVIENVSGKKVFLPNGTSFYIFKYKTADKNLLLETLVKQQTSDEAKSSKEFQKIDGAAIVEKITFFEKFLPQNTIDTAFLNDIKNNKSIEYYKVKRYPNASTLIYNPKNQMVYQFVEVKN